MKRFDGVGGLGRNGGNGRRGIDWVNRSEILERKLRFEELVLDMEFVDLEMKKFYFFFKRK